MLDQRFGTSDAADPGALLGDLDALLGGVADDYAAPAEAAPAFAERSGRAPPRMPPAPSYEFGDEPPTSGGAPTLLADWSLQQH
jgi:hypothetical protein